MAPRTVALPIASETGHFLMAHSTLYVSQVNTEGWRTGSWLTFGDRGQRG